MAMATIIAATTNHMIKLRVIPLREQLQVLAQSAMPRQIPLNLTVTSGA